MDEEIMLRLEALRHAVQTCGKSTPEHVLRVAREYLVFLKKEQA